MDLIRSKFMVDLVVLLLLTIIISSLLAVVIGESVEGYFLNTITSVIGDNGEYDFALIIDSELKEDALSEAEEIIAEHFPGSKLYPSLEVAGKSNFFLKLAPKHFNATNLAQADNYFSKLPGYNSLTLLVEPRITVTGLTNRGAIILNDKLSGAEGIEFAFVKGSRLEIILTDFRYLKGITEKIEKLLTDYRLLTVNASETELLTELLAEFPEVEELTPQEDELATLLGNLSLLTDVIEDYNLTAEDNLVSGVLEQLNTFMSRLNYESGLFKSIKEAENILAEFKEGAILNQSSLEQLKLVTTRSQNFLEALTDNLAQLEFLTEIEETLTVFGLTDLAFLSYIKEFNRLSFQLKSWQEELAEINQLLVEIDNLNSFETEMVTEQLSGLEEILVNLDSLNLVQEIEKLVYIEDILVKLTDEELITAFDSLNRYTSSYQNASEELFFLLPPATEEELFINQFKELYNLEELKFYTSNWGLIAPNLRGEIHRILSEVKTLLVILVILAVTALAMIFDQSLVLNFLKITAKAKSRFSYLALAYSLVIGGILFTGAVYLTGVELYYLPGYIIPVPGLLLGLIVYKKAAEFNQIKLSELQAGLAFGFNHAEILREIIIPAAKPGLLYLLNKKRSCL